MATLAKPVKLAPPKIVLPPNALKLKESVIVTYSAIIPAGHTKDDVLQPNYWAHWAKKLQRNFQVEVTEENYKFHGKLIVMAADNATVRMWAVEWCEQEAAEIQDSDVYKVIQSATGFRIVIRASGETVREGIPTRKLAHEAVAELERLAA